MTKLEITLPQLSRHLWTRQGFDATEAPRPAAEVIDAVPGVYGAAPSCYLSVLARSPSANVAEVDDLLYTRRSVVRTRAMRATLFLVTVRDLPDIFQATSRLTRDAFAELVRNSGLSDDAYQNAAARIEAALEAAPLTIGEIRQAVRDLPADVVAALNYIIGLMCGEGRLIRAGVRGGWKSDITEYARLRDWLPGVDLASGDAERGRVLLARRYFHAFGPASAEDFHWWSGLPREDADAAIAAVRDELVPIAVQDLPGELLVPAATVEELTALPDEGPRGIRLLPAWDPFLTAYRVRGRFLQPRWYDRVYDRAGNPTSTVLRDGRIGGIWDMEERQGRLDFKVALFDPADRRTWREVDRAAERIAKAIGAGPYRVLRCPLPPPFTAGSNRLRSPLQGIEGERPDL